MSRAPKKASDTATEAQERRIIAALRRGPKTTDQLRALGCYQVSARIHTLRHRRGFEISTELFNGYSVDGYSHARMARYTLIGEPRAVAVREPGRRGGGRPAGAKPGAH